MIARILGGQAADGGPIKLVSALGEKSHKSITQQGGKRHRHAKSFGRRQREADVLVTERRSKGCRLKLVLSDEAAVGFVCRYVKNAGGDEFDVRVAVDSSVADERDGLAQRLDRGCCEKIAAEFYKIRCGWVGADRKGLLSHRSEQRLTRIDRRGIAGGDDE